MAEATAADASAESDEARRIGLEPYQHLSARTTYLVLAAIVAFAAVVRQFMFVGLVRLDMIRYVELSNHVLEGGSLFDEQVFYASSRLTLIGPLLASNWIAGFGEHVSTAWPFLLSLGFVVVAFFLGKELYDERVGLIAALGASLAPIEIEQATQLLPDPIEAFFVPLAILCGVLAIKRDAHWRWWAFAAGACVGLAYFTRVNAILFIVGVLAIGLILDTPKWKRSLFSLVGLAAVLAAAAAVFFALSGDPFVDWTRTSEFYSTYSGTGFIERASTFFAFFRDEPALRWLGVALLIGTVGALVRRTRPDWLLLAWAWGWYVYLEFISPLHGLDSSYRYAEPMVIPALVLFGAALFLIVDRLPRRWGQVLVVAVVVASFLLLLPAKDITDRWRSNKRWTAVRSVERTLDELESLPIYVEDEWTVLALNVYSKFDYGRDTLEPPDAEVNADARLFRFEEGEIPATGEAFVVSATRPESAGVIEQVAAFPWVDQKDLIIWRVSP
jgi:4-amino-4-deoxy-L-arabinose transferase-like glycosyltransferase